MQNELRHSHHQALPTTVKEAKRQGWTEPDVVLFTGDAYIDHPAFGVAVIGRILQAQGLKVAIVPQPNWQDDLRDFKKFGKPKLFFGVTAGAMDSMVNHYTANKRLRSNDAYTPGNKSGFRPDYPTLVYSRILRELFPDSFIIAGGIEASLRRFTHYDYWKDQLQESFLYQSNADLLVYGMGERVIKDLAILKKQNTGIHEIKNLPQIGYTADAYPPKTDQEDTILYSHEDCLKNKINFAKNFKKIEQESNKLRPSRIIQKVKNQYIIVNPPYDVPAENEIDEYFDLFYTRKPHPKYQKKGVIPAYEMIRHSINSHRGCFGGCSFCTISAHQGKFIASRSEHSILKEVDEIVKMDDFKGYITDLGGPSANMYKIHGKNMQICLKCNRPSCLYPSKCKNLNDNHAPMNILYKKVRHKKGVKKVTIGSGIRYDLFMDDIDKKEHTDKKIYFEALVKHHVSGRLKVAPEHTEASILKTMRKPQFEMFIRLKNRFDQLNKRFNMKQQLIPYFISSHPECKLTDMAELSVKTKKLGYALEQIQDFTPTPMTLSTVMFFTGMDPYTLKPVHVSSTYNEKKDQQILFFWYKKELRGKIKSILSKINRKDLIPELLEKRLNKNK